MIGSKTFIEWIQQLKEPIWFNQMMRHKWVYNKETFTINATPANDSTP